MSIETTSLIQESLGSKPYCTKKQLINLCLGMGLCGSVSGATTALKALPWIKVTPKRSVVPRMAVLEYLKNNIKDSSSINEPTINTQESMHDH